MRLKQIAVMLGLLATPGMCRAQDAATPSTAATGAIRGVDVSVYEGTIDWSKAAASGIKFAFVRASDGFHHDTCFAKNWSGTQAAGVLRGAYQYFRAGEDGAAQANDFMDIVTAAGAGDLAPVADVETLDGVSASTLATQLAAWMSVVQSRGGGTPIIYTAPGLWNDWHMPSYGSNPLWVANWAVSKPKLPTGWSDWTFWQYSSDSAIPGISSRCDADLFHGTLDELKAFAGTGAAPAPGQPIPALPAPVYTPGLAAIVNSTSGAPSTGALPGGSSPGSASPGGASTSPANPTAAEGDPLLKLTSAGSNVRRLQSMLNAAGADLSVDGDFGPKTEAAVKAFQALHNCAVDGVVGPQTWGALEGLQSASPAPSAATAPSALPSLGGD